MANIFQIKVYLFKSEFVQVPCKSGTVGITHHVVVYDIDNRTLNAQREAISLNRTPMHAIANVSLDGGSTPVEMLMGLNLQVIQSLHPTP